MTQVKYLDQKSDGNATITITPQNITCEKWNT